MKTSIAKWIKDNFIMPKKYKNKVIERNIKILLKLSLIVLTFSVVMLIVSIINTYLRGKDETEYVLYYATMIVSNLLTYSVSLFFIKKKKDSLNNIPLFINFIGLEINCYYTFMTIPNTYNALIIFVCIATIIPIVFAIEPLYYTIVLIIMSSLMAPKIKTLYDISAVYNSAFYIGIMAILAMNRWLNNIRNMNHAFEIEEHEKMLSQELEMAAVIQKSFYHHNLGDLKDWEIAYYNDPMISLSGDLFDFYLKDKNLHGLSIFDVSGHGLSSGLITMMVKNTLEEEFFANEDVELDYTMRRINKRVREEKGNIENYLTGIILRLINKKPEIVIAGHPSPVIFNSATNKCDFYDCDIKYRQGAIGLGYVEYDFYTLDLDLNCGDAVILYTDGITEAKNIDGTEYGKKRFLQSVQSHCNEKISNQIDDIILDVKNFIGEAPRTDDISIIILKKK